MPIYFGFVVLMNIEFYTATAFAYTTHAYNEGCSHVVGNECSVYVPVSCNKVTAFSTSQRCPPLSRRVVVLWYGTLPHFV